MPLFTGGAWYATNADRAFPLDDAATARDDSGEALPPDVLVDCALRFPAALGETAHVASVTAGPGGASVVFAASPGALTSAGAGAPAPARASNVPVYGKSPYNAGAYGGGPASGPANGAADGGNVTPIATATFSSGAAPYSTVVLRALAPGVAGWAVFGPGALRPYTGRFSSRAQTALLPRCASSWAARPVTSLSKFMAPALQGAVRLAAGDDMSVSLENLVVVQDGRDVGPVPAIVFSMRTEALGEYVGPCGGRPESDTCGSPIITRFGGQAPGPDGDIVLTFPGAATYPMPHGAAVELNAAPGAAAPPTVASLCAAAARAATSPDTGAAVANIGPCGLSVDFTAGVPAGFDVLRGAFSSSASGYAASPTAPLNLSAAAFSRPLASASITFSSLRAGNGPANGGVAFGVDGRGAGGAAWFDMAAGTFNVGTFPPGGAPTALASAPASAGPVRSAPAASANITVTFGASTVPGRRRVSAFLVCLTDTATVAADVPVGDGGAGPITWSSTTTFLSLQLT